MSVDGLYAAVWGNITQRATFIVFVALNGLLMLYAVPDGPYVAGGDVGTSIEPARALLDGRGFVFADGRPFTWGTPFYPIFLAIFIGLLPWKIALFAIVTAQCALLYSIGLMTRKLAGFFSPKAATLAQIILIFNPNILVTAHLIQTEILFTFFLTAGLLAILRYSEAPSWSGAAIAGALVGFATLVRPVGQFVILLLPILVMIAGARNGSGMLRRSLASGVVAAVLAIAVISPWLLRNYLQFGTLFLTTNAGVYLGAQYRQLLHNGYGMAETETLAAGAQAERLHSSHIELGPEELAALPQIERSRILSSAYLNAIAEVPPSVHARALLESWFLLYVGGGASNIRNYLGTDSSDGIVQFEKEGRTGIADAASRLFSRINLGYVILLVVAFGYTITMRAAGVAGLIGMFRAETRHAVIIILAIMVILTLSYLYLGQSRFRVPLEPYLAIMAAVGIASSMHRLQSLWRKRPV